MKSIAGMQEQLDSQRQKVDVEVFDVTVRELTRMAADGELVRAPTYQRKFRWAQEDESRLIESVFLGLPVPSVFVATNKDGRWELVDGLQRVSTLAHFVAGAHTSGDDRGREVARTKVLQEIGKPSPLVLKGLSKLSALEGLCFDDLPHPLQLAFLKRGLKLTALSDKSDYSVRFDVFERLNRGGVALTEQEVRTCIYRGQFADMLRTLSEDPTFAKLIKLQAAHLSDGTQEELVLKFFAYRDKRSEFKGNVRGFLNSYMEAAAATFDTTRGQSDFNAVVGALWSHIQGPILRKGVAISPLNQVEAIFVATYELLQQGRTISAIGTDWLNDSQLVRASTGGTNTPKMLNDRIKRAGELLAGAAPTMRSTTGGGRPGRDHMSDDAPDDLETGEAGG